MRTEITDDVKAQPADLGVLLDKGGQQMDGCQQFNVVVATEIVNPCQNGLHGELPNVCRTCHSNTARVTFNRYNVTQAMRP